MSLEGSNRKLFYCLLVCEYRHIAFREANLECSWRYLEGVLDARANYGEDDREGVC